MALTTITHPQQRMLTRNRVVSRQRGAQMVEFVLLVPMFLVLVLFMVAVSNMLFIQSQLLTAAYAGSRAAAQYGATSVNGGGMGITRRAVDTTLTGVSLVDKDRAQVQWYPQQCSTATQVITTRITYDYPVDLLLLDGAWTIKLSASGVAQCEIAN